MGCSDQNCLHFSTSLLVVFRPGSINQVAPSPLNWPWHPQRNYIHIITIDIAWSPTAKRCNNYSATLIKINRGVLGFARSSICYEEVHQQWFTDMQENRKHTHENTHARACAHYISDTPITFPLPPPRASRWGVSRGVAGSCETNPKDLRWERRWQGLPANTCGATIYKWTV